MGDSLTRHTELPGPDGQPARQALEPDEKFIEANPVRHQSNNWAISGAHTESGKPMLAGDPHIPLILPNTWYLAHVSYPGQDVAGATSNRSDGALETRGIH